ncbi:MAG: hypothetical protein BZY88_19945 [SAR202 cluster bacterium Io17-Chloro-G9]|nr:MAG: hypothetical protein BZY88_19945 [SAR202 cluster bacterium Io17-Chloro-G9]
MASQNSDPYLKYALFCRETEEGPGDNLVLKGVIDLVELPQPKTGTPDPGNAGTPVLAEVDVNLAFCIGGATPGLHHLLVAIKTPGIPLDLPPPQQIEWEEGILFQRWIKVFRIPVQAEGDHVAAILLDGAPLGEASFLVRFKADDTGSADT